MGWIAVALAGVLGLALLYWLLVIAEGAYLGPKVVTWLYDRGARSYDRIKALNVLDEAHYLALPILQRLGEVRCSLVLDVATGTGRLPLALLRQPDFRGHIVGLDLSWQMLAQAKAKSAWCRQRLDLIQCEADVLPFREGYFDLVTCLEALEFMPDPRRAVGEMVRVLRPGGLLLVSNRVGWESRLLWGRWCGRGRLERLLAASGLQEITTQPWQVHYDLIWARKGG